MPYADKNKQREAQARSYRNRLADPDFKEAESIRKQRWQATEHGREMNRLRQARWRASRAG